jgi:hypothetical protein
MLNFILGKKNSHHFFEFVFHRKLHHIWTEFLILGDFFFGEFFYCLGSFFKSCHQLINTYILNDCWWCYIQNWKKRKEKKEHRPICMQVLIPPISKDQPRNYNYALDITHKLVPCSSKNCTLKQCEIPSL